MYSTVTGDTHPPAIDVVNLNPLFEINTTSVEVVKVLQKLNPRKAIGTDGVPSRILKNFASQLSKPLSVLFNLSFKLGRVPSIWKQANIAPVHKDGEKELVEHCRSISLLPVPGKCQERLVHDAIYNHVLPFLPDWQHGFMKGKSCATQLDQANSSLGTSPRQWWTSWCFILELF